MNYTMPITNPILRRLYELMDERGTNAKRVTEALHLSGSSFTDWKKGKASPGVEALTKFSQYFGVSLDYLVTGHEFDGEKRESKEEPPPETDTSNLKELSNPIDEELLAKYHRLPPEYQGKVMAYLDGMLAVLSTPQAVSRPSAPAGPAEPETRTEALSVIQQQTREEDGRKSA